MKKLYALLLLTPTIQPQIKALMSTITIQQAKSADIPACIAICTSPSNKDQIFPKTDESEIERYFSVFPEDEFSKLIVAKKENQVVGFAVVTMRGLPQENINIIAVSEQYQKQGIGSKLLEYIKALHNHAVLKLSVLTANRPAIRAYEKQGFVCSHTLDEYGVYTYQPTRQLKYQNQNC